MIRELGFVKLEDAASHKASKRHHSLRVPVDTPFSRYRAERLDLGLVGLHAPIRLQTSLEESAGLSPAYEIRTQSLRQHQA